MRGYPRITPKTLAEMSCARKAAQKFGTVNISMGRAAEWLGEYLKTQLPIAVNLVARDEVEPEKWQMVVTVVQVGRQPIELACDVLDFPSDGLLASLQLVLG